MRLAGPILAALLLSGCVTTPPNAAGPTGAPSGAMSSPSAQVTTGPVATAGSTLSVPSATSATTSATPSAGYTGPLPMPAADGKPMLWPTTRPVVVGSYGSDPLERHGFVDSTGKLVAQARYDGYQYCPDASGRPAFVIASSADEPAEVLDLTGKVILRAPTAEAGCAAADHIIFTRVRNRELGDWDSGVLTVSTGKVVLPPARLQHIDRVGEHVLNVAKPDGEYFFDLATGKRTPHVGFIYDPGPSDADAPGLPATARRSDTGLDGPIGYVTLGGAWAVKPVYDSASRFEGGFAVVQRDADATFLDARFGEVGGVWDEIEPVGYYQGDSYQVAGYLVTRNGETGLLDAGLRTVVEPGTALVQCDWGAGGTCLLTSPDGTARLRLADGTFTDVPSGFNLAFNQAFLAAKTGGEDEDASYAKLYAVAGAKVIESAGWRRCRPAGTAWLACQSTVGAVPPDVFDANGNRSRFARITAVDDPTGGPGYFWATSGQYQGFVDATGTWLYRESRFNELED